MAANSNTMVSEMVEIDDIVFNDGAVNETAVSSWLMCIRAASVQMDGIKTFRRICRLVREAPKTAQAALLSTMTVLDKDGRRQNVPPLHYFILVAAESCNNINKPYLLRAFGLLLKTQPKAALVRGSYAFHAWEGHVGFSCNSGAKTSNLVRVCGVSAFELLDRIREEKDSTFICDLMLRLSKHIKKITLSSSSYVSSSSVFSTSSSSSTSSGACVARSNKRADTCARTSLLMSENFSDSLFLSLYFSPLSSLFSELFFTRGVLRPPPFVCPSVFFFLLLHYPLSLLALNRDTEALFSLNVIAHCIEAHTEKERVKEGSVFKSERERERGRDKKRRRLKWGEKGIEEDEEEEEEGERGRGREGGGDRWGGRK